MHYEIYIDVVFVTNLLMDYILLRFTGKSSGVEKAGEGLFWEHFWEPCFPVVFFMYQPLVFFRQ